MKTAKDLFKRRQRRQRYAIKTKSSRIRLSIFRSGKHIYAQLIDDKQSVTLASASTLDQDLKGKISSSGTVEAALQVGRLIAERAKKANVEKVVFDRGGYIYHGRIKALADAAREAGLDF